MPTAIERWCEAVARGGGEQPNVERRARRDDGEDDGARRERREDDERCGQQVGERRELARLVEQRRRRLLLRHTDLERDHQKEGERAHDRERSARAAAELLEALIEADAPDAGEEDAAHKDGQRQQRRHARVEPRRVKPVGRGGRVLGPPPGHSKSADARGDREEEPAPGAAPAVLVDNLRRRARASVGTYSERRLASERLGVTNALVMPQ